MSTSDYPSYIKSLYIDPDEMVAVSPDMGGADRTRYFAKRLNCPIALIDKRRDKHERNNCIIRNRRC